MTARNGAATALGNGAASSAEVKTAARSVIAMAREKGLKMVDFKFIDLPGLWQHFSIPVGCLDEGVFLDGVGFDGSSIRGFQHIHESDMLLMPDSTTAIVDPIGKVPTLSIICNVVDPVTRLPYSRDPRYVAMKAEGYLVDSGAADLSYWGAEAEFYVFNSIRFDQNAQSGYYFIDSEEGIWNSGQNGTANLGYRPRHKEGYFPVPPTDRLQDLRSEIVLKLLEAGLEVEAHHHEVATAGQCEIDLRFQPLTKMADWIMLYKYVIKNVCVQAGYTATFMPKPLFRDNGSGMHTHQSLWKDGMNLFYVEKGYAGLSDLARWDVGGLLKHAPAILAFAAPTTNSYRRLVPGYEAPVNLMYSQRNRSACVRIPVYSNSPRAKRIEFRPPDCSCNPYLAFAAMLMAGIDGVQNRIEPPTPIDKDLYELEPEEA
ncbi:MAG: type I glutamate--ammonia ligase, partial [Chloroflexi bacterium]|nr:type I glutamate--ammonia ligase [Chloroflexota bacterium]